MALIFDAVRSPRAKGKLGGSLSSLKPDELVAKLIDAIRHRGGDLLEPDALILGAVGQVGSQGGNVALVSKFRASLPDHTTAFTTNNYCVSGLTAINQAAAMIDSKQATSVLAGGVEMMSQVPFMADKADFYQDNSLPTNSRYLLVALAADRLAEDEGITRDELDKVTLLSQQRAASAENTPLIASRIAIENLNSEECLKLGTADSLAALEPAFAAAAPHYADILGRAIDHRHTIAHAPPVADGAALALVGADGAVSAKPRAKILASADIGGDPAESLTACFTAMELALSRANLSLDDMDRIEFMEAFAVTIAKFLRDYPVSPEKVNVGGGHIAKGHPLGATGAILVSSLLDALDEADGRYGIVVAAGASGAGSALVVQRLEH